MNFCLRTFKLHPTSNTDFPVPFFTFLSIFRWHRLWFSNSNPHQVPRNNLTASFMRFEWIITSNPIL